jgi:multiple sugar transport system permease protein
MARLRLQRLSYLQRRRLTTGLIFVSPWLLGLVLLSAYPLLSSIYYSLNRYDLLRPPVYLGLGNYIEIFTVDPHFKAALLNTFYYVGIGVPLSMGAAFLSATLLNTRIIGRPLFRAIFYFPAIVPATVSAAVWSFMLNPQYGAINASLRALGLPIVPFITSAHYALPSIIGIAWVWGSGYTMVLFLATLQDVPRDLYEAATVDGANAWHRYWYITIPFCTPVILFNLVTGLIYGFQDFTFIRLLTNGGPADATEVFSLNLYKNAFEYLRMGKASAMAWVMFVIVVILTVVLFKSSARVVYYADSDR